MVPGSAHFKHITQARDHTVAARSDDFEYLQCWRDYKDSFSRQINPVVKSEQPFRAINREYCGQKTD